MFLTPPPVNGFATERWGYKPVILGCLVWLTGITAIFFTAPNIQILLVAEILAGEFSCRSNPITPPTRPKLTVIRYSLGCVPVDCHLVCLRGRSSRTPWICHHLGKQLLG